MENQQTYILEKEIGLLKKELILELEIRERELKEYRDLQKRYYKLEKRYFALANSFLGKITIKYWGLRRRLRSENALKGK